MILAAPGGPVVPRRPLTPSARSARRRPARPPRRPYSSPEPSSRSRCATRALVASVGQAQETTVGPARGESGSRASSSGRTRRNSRPRQPGRRRGFRGSSSWSAAGGRGAIPGPPPFGAAPDRRAPPSGPRRHRQHRLLTVALPARSTAGRSLSPGRGGHGGLSRRRRGPGARSGGAPVHDSILPRRGATFLAQFHIPTTFREPSTRHPAGWGASPVLSARDATRQLTPGRRREAEAPGKLQIIVSFRVAGGERRLVCGSPSDREEPYAGYGSPGYARPRAAGAIALLPTCRPATQKKGAGAASGRMRGSNYEGNSRALSSLFRTVGGAARGARRRRDAVSAA